MRIGTRGSALALWQARTVARRILETGGPECEIVVIRTSGDEKSTLGTLGTSGTSGTLGTLGTLRTLGTPGTPGTLNVKRSFVKEIEDALLEGRVDVAVHSAKDLPGDLPDGLIIAATLAREDPHDALLLPAAAANGFDAVKARLGQQPRLGTSSVRRMAQLRAVFPSATFLPIRGNVDTRLRKLDAGDCDALVLAAAGVKRLGLEQRISALIPTAICLPAPGQGIVAVEIAERAAAPVRDAVKRIADADADTALTAERAVVQALGGGCQMPLGALTTLDGQAITVEGLVASLDGQTVLRAEARGHRGAAAATGEKLAAKLIARGAAEFLK
jgi:hydroxymethylbilane synthase